MTQMRLTKSEGRSEYHLKMLCNQQGGSLRVGRVITDTARFRFDIVEARYMSDMNDMSDICYIGWSGACGIGGKNHTFFVGVTFQVSETARSPRAQLRHRCIADN